MDTAAVLLLLTGVVGIRYIEDHHKHMAMLKEIEKLKDKNEELETSLKEVRDTCVYLNLTKYKKQYFKHPITKQ